MSITRIAVFDFDGTLVNTPLKPDGWKGGWWGREASLLPPFVPHHFDLKEKGVHLLNEKVVKAYIENKARKDTHTVMMTGRHWGLRKHVMNILHGFKLCTKDDCEGLVEESDNFIFISGGRTLEGKLARLTSLLQTFPEVHCIEMWEDREEHIPHFRDHSKELKRIRPNFEGVIVHEPPDWD
jgi:hypothetical protein